MGERESAGPTGAERSERSGKPMSRAPWGPRQGPHFSGAQHALASGAERRASEKGGACPAGSRASEASVEAGRGGRVALPSAAADGFAERAGSRWREAV